MITKLIDRVRASFCKDKQLQQSLYAILGFYPRNLEPYRIALVHKSQVYRGRGGKDHPLNNERLEYLGDAILEAVVSDIVFHRFPRRDEGFLTATRSKIVQRSSLNNLAVEIGLDKLIRCAAARSSHNSNIAGNAFEALIGAIYKDRGYKHVKWFVEKRIVGRLLDIDAVAGREVNFKSKLLEWAQKNRLRLDFCDEQGRDDESNSPLFRCIVKIEGVRAGDGRGYSKKEAQQATAKDALLKLRRNKRLYESVYAAKEKRTAMEAPEICAVPQIDENAVAPASEVEPARKSRSRGGKARNAKDTTREGQNQKRTEAAADKDATPAKAAEKQQTAKRRRAPRATAEGAPAENAAQALSAGEQGNALEAATMPAAQNLAQEPAETATLAANDESPETVAAAPAKRRRRRGGARRTGRRPAAEGGEAEAQSPAEAAPAASEE